MKSSVLKIMVCYLFFLPVIAIASIHVGIGKADMTPPIGTPSAGYADRKGEGMVGVHDSLLAIALYLDNEEKKIVLCSVDHLGFNYDMVQEVIHKVQAHSDLAECHVYIASSHTHSGGGAYLNIPFIGEVLAGPYNKSIEQFYIEKTAEAILLAYQNQTLAKVGIGYGNAEVLSQYRSRWPKDVSPLSDVTVIKVTHLDDAPLAVFFNYPVHPTVLTGKNRLFSADFVGYARDHLQSLLGQGVQPIYFNGAQGDIIPMIQDEEDQFKSCDKLANSLAKTAKEIWDATKVSDQLKITAKKESYSFSPKPTPQGLVLPIDTYKTEMNLIILNELHAFITIPGELSCLYDTRLKVKGDSLGFSHVSIFGLTNDAHGYIILPESWQHKTYESGLSFGGEFYGDLMEKRAQKMLEDSIIR